MARDRNWYRTQKGKTYSDTVSPSMNKSGIFLGGSTGSGTTKSTAAINYPKGVSLRRGKATAAKRGVGLTAPSGSGANRKAGWVGEGADRRYVEAVTPVADRGKGASGSSRSVVTAQQGEGRPTPSESRGGTSKLAANLASKSSGSSAPKAEVGTLNYFMQKTMADGRGNARNRAYTLYKRYKQAERRNA